MSHQHIQAFPTLISVFDLTDYDRVEKERLMNAIFNTDKGRHYLLDDEQGPSSTSASRQFLDQYSMIKLKIKIQECIDIYCEESGMADLDISTSWFNIIGNKGKLRSHRHELSVVSGAYYPYCDPNSAFLNFESPVSMYKMNELGKRETLYNVETMSYPVRTDLLILFPSWLYHYVDSNQTEERISLAFNTELKK